MSIFRRRKESETIKFLTACISSTCLAAAFVLGDDETWANFVKFVNDMDIQEGPIDDSSRPALDRAIAMTDELRRIIRIQNGLPVGDKYERKYG